MREGILLVNKPRDMTSHDVVAIVRKRTGIAKIGHAGTLDPFAQGLLILLVGSSTRRFGFFQTLMKEYEGEIEFGARTDTYDGTGKTIFTYQGKINIETERLKLVLSGIKGTQEQVPPAFSAVKVRGKKSYELARRGILPSLPPKTVTVQEADLIEVKGKRARVRFVVSSGTYIRSFAHLIGEKMGVGGFLVSLVRSRIGPYALEDARSPFEVSLQDLRELP